MKFNSLKRHSVVKFGLVPVLASALSIIAATAIANSATETAFAETASLVAQSQPTIALAGTFVAAEAPTTGTAQIIEEDGQRYLVLDSAFSTTD
jgi:hypothetical protein